MNVLFWNINRNVTEGKEKIERYIINCVAENDVDIAVFAEYKDKNGSVINIDCAAIERGLGNMFTWIKGIEPDGAVILLARKSIGKVCKIQQDIDSRYSLYVVDTALKKYLLAAVHLEDRQNDPYSEERIETIRRLRNEITENEEFLNIENTLVIGDFNANPYDRELTSKRALNAVLFKGIIKASEYTNPRSDRIKRFYNPIIHYLSEDTEMYGSFYFSNANKYWTPYWCCLDQVLVRKSLVDLIQDVTYLKAIAGDSLLKRTNIPQDKISDHLPLLLKLLEVRNGV